MVYAGSIDRVDFGEQNEDKGWVYVEIPEKGRAEWEFRKVSARPFLTIEATVESDNATEDVVRAILRHAERLENAVVRLRIDVPPERTGRAARRRDPGAAQERVLRDAVRAHRRASGPRSRWGAAGAAIQRAGPIEALSLYLEHQKVEADRRATLVRYAQTLMNEDELMLDADAWRAFARRSRSGGAMPVVLS